MPKDLPHNININTSTLVNIGDQILAQDIPLSAGVTLKENPEEVVALVSAPREEKEEEVPAPDLSQIELSEERGKKEEEPSATNESEAKKEAPPA